MSNEDARYQQGQTALLRLAVAAHDAVNKVIVPVDGDEFVTLPEGCPVFPGETVAGGERHLSAIDVLRHLVSNWDEAHEDHDDVTIRPTDHCGCGYPVVWVNGHWEHDAAPYLWGDDHEADAPEPTGGAREYWDVEDGVTEAPFGIGPLCEEDPEEPQGFCAYHKTNHEKKE